MNLRLLDLLACPHCNAEALNLTPFEAEGPAAIHEGVIRCGALYFGPPCTTRWPTPPKALVSPRLSIHLIKTPIAAASI